MLGVGPFARAEWRLVGERGGAARCRVVDGKWRGGQPGLAGSSMPLRQEMAPISTGRAIKALT